MASKDQKTFKKFPKRLLSSFRKGRKHGAQAENLDLEVDAHELLGFTKDDLEAAKSENAIINQEATLNLGSPKRKGKLGTSAESSVNVTPKRQSRGQTIDTGDDVSNFSTPRPQRLVLGHVMSASTDSGIDCSILMSERSSPEQFVAFTRREAERLRQEQLHNGSVLETLTEVSKTSSEESVTELTDANDTNKETVNQNIEKDTTECENEIEGAVGGVDVMLNETVENLPKEVDDIEACDKNLVKETISDTCDNAVMIMDNNERFEIKRENKSAFDGDYVLLTESSEITYPLVDAAKIIEEKKHSEDSNRSVTCVSDNANQSDVAESSSNRLGNVIQVQPAFDDNHSAQVNDSESIELIDVTNSSYMSFYVNRTDEIKSAEARMRQSSPGATLNLAAPNHIVNPIPIQSSSVATHRALPSTPSPARLYINENSAFAKCKSLKRSMSDVGKGILGRLRNLSKEDNDSKYEYVCGRPAGHGHGKQSGLIKKLGGWKDKRSYKVKNNDGKVKKRGRHKSDLAVSFIDDSDDMLELDDKFSGADWDLDSSSFQSLSGKAGAFEANIGEKNLTTCARESNSKKQSFYREILSDDVKQELEASFQRQRSPVMLESIHDFTASISEMTTALCASSVESIACICDCKNRNSNPDCCEKRKTPSPTSTNDCIDKNASASFSEVSPGIVGENSRLNLSTVDYSLNKGQTMEYSLNEGENIEYSSNEVRNVDCSSNEDRHSPDTGKPGNNPTVTIENEVTEQCSPCSYNKVSYCGNGNKASVKKSTEQSGSTFETDEVSSDESTDENDGDDYYSDDNGSCSCDECSDLDCSQLCNVSPNTGNVNLLSSSSDSESSLNDSFEVNSTIRKQHSKTKPDSCENCVESPASTGQNDCSFNIGDSPYSVTFKEIDFENGDVMYLSNNLNEDFEKCWKNDSSMSPDTTAVCEAATPMSSPRTCMFLPLVEGVDSHNKSIVLDTSQNTVISDSVRDLERIQLPEDCIDGTLSSSADRVVIGCDQRQCEPPSSTLPSNASPSPLNLTQDSSFTNVSFEGSFADVSFSVSGNSRVIANRTSSLTCINRNESDNQRNSHMKPPRCSRLDLLNDSSTVNQLNVNKLNDSRFMYRSDRTNPNERARSRDESNILKHTLSRNHNRSLNESGLLDLSYRNSMKESGSRNSRSVNLNKSWAPGYREDGIDTIEDVRNRSYQGGSPMSSPLDLSINKGRNSSHKSMPRSQSDKDWVQRHLGQVYSPAKRVLHKNSGLSESDLCKQILDIYVSDADESGFDLSFADMSLDSSHHATADESVLSANLDNDSDGSGESLKFGTYVAPRHVVKETNVDDFRTTTVYTCYSGEARTRKLPGKPNSSVLSLDESHIEELADEQDLQSGTWNKERKQVRDRGSNSGKLKSQRSSGREALRDRTNTSHRLSSLELPQSLASGIDAKGLEDEIRGKKQCSSNMRTWEILNRKHIYVLVDLDLHCPQTLFDTYIHESEKGFDRLTMLHTAHNGQRKVRCLSMDESQSIVKCYPPPKEASRVSWGQTISELDLYRHTPRKTPVKTRPILNQKENSYPYEDDSPSPIVLTKMRKPKSLAKKYKNWPWS